MKLGRVSIWLMIFGRSQFNKARKTHSKSHWKLWQQEPGTEMLVTSGPQVGSRRQVRPAYTLQSPTLYPCICQQCLKSKRFTISQLVPTARDQVFKYVNLLGTCHSRSKTAVKSERDQGWSRFLQQCLSEVNVSSSSSDSSNRNKYSTYTQHTQQHNIQCTQHIHIHHKHTICATHTTPYTQRIPQRLLSHVHSTSTEA